MGERPDYENTEWTRFGQMIVFSLRRPFGELVVTAGGGIVGEYDPRSRMPKGGRCPRCDG
jgi:hypothetical protein